MTYLKNALSGTLPALILSLAGLAAADRAAADSNPYIGEIAPMGIINFCPNGWLSAEGQLLAISQYDALFSLLGTTFGGDGINTFGLPDLRGRVPVGVGSGPGLSVKNWGAVSGQQSVTLTQNTLASHSHAVNATNSDGNFAGPGDKILAAAPDDGTGTETIYSDQPATVQMSAQMIAPTGGSQPVAVLDPSQVIRYCIALVGIYPSRS